MKHWKELIRILIVAICLFFLSYYRLISGELFATATAAGLVISHWRYFQTAGRLVDRVVHGTEPMVKKEPLEERPRGDLLFEKLRRNAHSS